MTYTRTKFDYSLEGEIVRAMIVDTEFLGQIQAMAKPELFISSWAGTVWRWVLDYFTKYKIAPGKEIQNIYSDHKKKGTYGEDIDLIGEFLATLSTAYEDKDEAISPALPDRAYAYFEERQARLTSEQALGQLVAFHSSPLIKTIPFVPCHFSTLTSFPTMLSIPIRGFLLRTMIDQTKGNTICSINSYETKMMIMKLNMPVRLKENLLDRHSGCY